MFLKIPANKFSMVKGYLLMSFQCLDEVMQYWLLEKQVSKQNENTELKPRSNDHNQVR